MIDLVAVRVGAVDDLLGERTNLGQPPHLVGLDHDHDRGEPCPMIAWGCDACSLTAEGWAGELEGTYLPECVVDAPCSVLTTIARHYGVRVAELVDARVEAASGHRGGETCGDVAGAGRTARVDP